MMTAKRKLSMADTDLDTPIAKKSNFMGYDARTPWLYDSRPTLNRRTSGNPAVQHSLPLANMVSTVQDLIDPDFDPLIAILDDEPRFLKPLPSRISPEDLELLRFRGALSIPERGLRNELLRCYIQWVHSFMPVLNLQEFLRCVAENDLNGNISLLLFQAVMFVATAFVDFKHLQDAGYSTRKSARNAFYERLRLLYSLDCEEDRIAILQTLLLMTYWSDQVNNPQRDIWDWVGICNTQAHSIGLNRDPTTSNMDPRMKRLRVRLWWSLYCRDRLIAMGMRRPTQVNEGTSSVPMLRLDDFDFEPYHPSVIEIFRCRQLEDTSHQKRLATMFIEKAKLCQSIGRVLFAQYTTSQCQFGVTNRTTITLVPRQASESELARCSQRLDSWLSALPKDAQFIPASKTNFKDGEDVLLLHGAMLRMLYHATISALHRPWAFHSNKDQAPSRLELAQTARSKMHDAALGITHIIQGLNQLNMTRFLPQSGVTVIIPAAVAHLSNMMSDNPIVRETSLQHFQRCIKVLQGLKDLYPAADVEHANIEAAVKVQSDSISTFLKIMQYSDMKASQLRGPEPPLRRGSTDSIIHTISTEDRSPEQRDSLLGGTPRQRTESDVHRKDGHTERTSTKKESIATANLHNGSQPTNQQQQQRPIASNDFDDHFSLFPSPGSTSPFITTDLLRIDMDSFPDFKPMDTNMSSTPELDVDWTDELLGGSDLHLDGSGSSVDEPKDFFSFPSRREPGSISHSHCGITGDLDRDLGLALDSY
ncbi:transcription factor domain-containing protein [Aspergillus clavatus NRRL 1]|uniref:C6 transcription factor, putative n=1 Tax=Aspergillus clavatus (strain ATCC 1007 / CBS 513.65 / DSM 816 / NCTC 3887 / NRRL 1 / QM 1276 / 107) TaxID=344612 RepID=A1CG52_ASPCL|nr:C6 transcription factor, putative [Aspergillus clavatus NRRL 1]EAW10932.1 C6 transcription factor, putative [Aspergillus clavatus NRRL 1]